VNNGRPSTYFPYPDLIYDRGERKRFRRNLLR
jgi:hypothetical protein